MRETPVDHTHEQTVADLDAFVEGTGISRSAVFDQANCNKGLYARLAAKKPVEIETIQRLYWAMRSLDGAWVFCHERRDACLAALAVWAQTRDADQKAIAAELLEGDYDRCLHWPSTDRAPIRFPSDVRLVVDNQP